MHDPITHFVIMNKRTAKLCVGTRIQFVDRAGMSEASMGMSKALNIDPRTMFVTLHDKQRDGWIIEHPDLVLPTFMNIELENYFEILSEL